MSDTDGADRSTGNGSYIQWLEDNWDSFGPSESAPEEPVPFMPYPLAGHTAWPRRPVPSELFAGWIRGMKYGLYVTGGMVALMGAWSALGWFFNIGQTGFTP